MSESPASPANAEVISFPKSATRNASSTEKIWGKAVCANGYAGVPSILIQAQRRLGINSTQMNIIVQLLDYWREPARKPFPSKKELANRIGVIPKTIQNNIRELEKAGLIQRQLRKTAAGDWNSNIYHLDGLVKKVQAMEPEFTAERRKRQQARAALETPAGRRAGW
jgi:predicted transcriptional regulator